MILRMNFIYMGLKGLISIRENCSYHSMPMISHYFLRQRMAYRVDLMFYTITVKSGEFLSILLKQRLLYLEKGGFCQKKLRFFYNDTELEIVSSFSYLGIVFTSRESFSLAQKNTSKTSSEGYF